MNNPKYLTRHGALCFLSFARAEFPGVSIRVCHNIQKDIAGPTKKIVPVDMINAWLNFLADNTDLLQQAHRIKFRLTDLGLEFFDAWSPKHIELIETEPRRWLTFWVQAALRTWKFDNLEGLCSRIGISKGQARRAFKSMGFDTLKEAAEIEEMASLSNTTTPVASPSVQQKRFPTHEELIAKSKQMQDPEDDLVDAVVASIEQVFGPGDTDPESVRDEVVFANLTKDELTVLQAEANRRGVSVDSVVTLFLKDAVQHVRAGRRQPALREIEALVTHARQVVGTVDSASKLMGDYLSSITQRVENLRGK